MNDKKDSPTRVYLASPYSHPLKKVREFRYLIAVRALASYYRHVGEYIPFSPIAHTHPVAREVGPRTEFFDPLGFDWLAVDLPFLVCFAEELHILDIPRTEPSPGVEEERDRAKKLGLPVKYINPTLLYYMDVDLVEEHNRTIINHARAHHKEGEYPRILTYKDPMHHDN